MNYPASLGRTAYLVTIFAILVMIAVPLALAITIPIALFSLAAVSLFLPLIIVALCFWYRVTGYQIEGHNLIVKRMSFDYLIPLKAIKSVEYNKDAMKHSFRMFGNGGLFGFYGYFRNKSYGNYRAFVTNSKNVIVIKTEDKIFMVSPDNPEKFMDKLNQKLVRNLQLD